MVRGKPSIRKILESSGKLKTDKKSEFRDSFDGARTRQVTQRVRSMALKKVQRIVSTARLLLLEKSGTRSVPVPSNGLDQMAMPDSESD